MITADDSDSSQALIQIASLAIFMHGLQNKLLFRGAIACGEVVADLDKSIFFGNPIIDAYFLEEAQKWFGISIHHSAELHPKDRRTAKQITEDDVPFTTGYSVPLKNNQTEDLSVINWASAAKTLGYNMEEFFQDYCSSISESEQTKINEYIKNSLDFFNYVVEKNT